MFTSKIYDHADNEGNVSCIRSACYISMRGILKDFIVSRAFLSGGSMCVCVGGGEGVRANSLPLDMRS